MVFLGYGGETSPFHFTSIDDTFIAAMNITANVKEWDTDSVQNEAGCANGDGEFAFVLLEPSVTNETRREKGVRGRGRREERR